MQLGTEHAVDLSISSGRVGKTTILPAFGLVPAVISLPVVNLRAAPGETTTRDVIEFLHATPLEYLARWIANNDVFGDDVKLASVIAWPDARVSFGITQPQYHGQPAEPRDIEKHFMDAGWVRLRDPSGHVIFFNYAFNVMAIDAERRNCYLHEGRLLPFDVILHEPDEAM